MNTGKIQDSPTHLEDSGEVRKFREQCHKLRKYSANERNVKQGRQQNSRTEKTKLGVVWIQVVLRFTYIEYTVCN